MRGKDEWHSRIATHKTCRPSSNLQGVMAPRLGRVRPLSSSPGNRWSVNLLHDFRKSLADLTGESICRALHSNDHDIIYFVWNNVQDAKMDI